MADNPQEYGFRWVKSRGGGSNPVIEEGIVATSQSFDVNGGASNVNLRVGDPVIRLNTGGFNLCDGAEGAGGALKPYGIVMGIRPYWDGTFMKPTNKLPSDIAWGTNLERQSKILVCPIMSAYWEIDCDDSSTATTKAAYQAFLGENCDYRLNGASGDIYAYPRLDISAHGTANTLVFRIVGISGSAENKDFSGNYVKLIVIANLPQDPTDSTTGV